MRTTPSRHRISRRRFLLGAGAAASISIVPRSLLGGAGQTPPSERITVACIGVGSQGLRVMLGFLRNSEVHVVSVCDPERQRSSYPQWSRNEFRNAVRRLLGVDSGWEWLSENQPIQLTRSMSVTGGTAGREPCRQIVDAYYASRNPGGEHRGCTAYADYRELLDTEKDVDAVVICSTDRLHAPIAIAAMKKGKHVFCQKPVGYSVYEGRRVAEVARETGVATQVAVGNQASEDTRRLCEWVWVGAIGPVRQVHNWSRRPFWPQGLDRPTEAPPRPDGLDWDVWLGPAPERPFHPVYHPFNWRGWYDFGCGPLGDMGNYSFDPLFRALKLEAPASVEACSSGSYPETLPLASIIHFNFPPRGDMPPVRVTWYDGGLRPPRPEELGDDRELPDEGMLLAGDRGTILCGFNGRSPRLIPQARMDAFEEPPKTLPRSSGHEREWLDAAKGGKEKPGANFEFEGMVAETLQLGNLALRTGQRLVWNRAEMKVVNAPDAQQFVKPDCRPGWGV